MKRLLILFIFVSSGKFALSQIAVEALGGNKQMHYISYWQKDIDSLAKWNFFNLNRFTVNYRDKSLNTISTEGQLTYAVNSWLGVSAGAGYYGEGVLPSLGLSLSYMNSEENFTAQIYPSFVWADRTIIPALLGLVDYSPALNSKYKFSSSLIFMLDPSEGGMLCRMGMNYLDRLQFGVGFDYGFTFQQKVSEFNIGPFLRFTF